MISQKIKRWAYDRVGRRFHRALARRSFYFFCTYVYKDFLTAPHHLLIAEALDKMTSGATTRLFIALPPRHSKSLMCSELYPAYWLARNPTKQIIHASYASSLSNKFSMSVRSMVRDNVAYKELFPHMALDQERRRMDDWWLTSGGGFRSIGVTGGITGSGADLFIVDDPHKEGDELSPTALDVIWNWWASAAQTRLSPGAPVLLVMTRWHPNDMAGRSLRLAESDAAADQWETLIFPALAVAHDALGRSPGQALWPERYSRERLLAIRAVSERYFEALFQQNPEFSNEPLFAVGDFTRAIHHAASYFWTFDIAITEKERSDYTVCAKWSFSDDILCLHHIERFRAQWPVVKQALVDIMHDNPLDDLYFPTQLLELFALQTLRADADDPARIHEVVMPGDKHSRAVVLSDFTKNSTVIVCPGETGDQFVLEHVNFLGTAKHDDCVDVSSVATHAIGLQERFHLAIVGQVDDKNERSEIDKLGLRPY